MSRPFALALPLALLLLLWSDRTAQRVLDHDAERGFGAPGAGVGRARFAGFLPALRAFLVQAWIVRADVALRAGRHHAALSLCREAVALAPDAERARVRLADLLAYRLAPLEGDAARRLAWVGEGLAILEQGIERDPTRALLHTERGLMIWSRAESMPEFARAFVATHGRSALEEGVDALVRGAEFGRDDWRVVRAATIGLQQRGDARLEAGRAGAARFLAAAAADFERAAAYLDELIGFSDLARPALEVDRALARLSAELARLGAAQVEGREEPELEPALRELLARADALAERLAAGPELAPARARLGEVLGKVLAARAEDPGVRRQLIERAVSVLETGAANDPDGAQLYVGLLMELRNSR